MRGFPCGLASSQGCRSREGRGNVKRGTDASASRATNMRHLAAGVGPQGPASSPSTETFPGGFPQARSFCPSTIHRRSTSSPCASLDSQTRPSRAWSSGIRLGLSSSPEQRTGPCLRKALNAPPQRSQSQPFDGYSGFLVSPNREPPLKCVGSPRIFQSSKVVRLGEFVRRGWPRTGINFISPGGIPNCKLFRNRFRPDPSTTPEPI